MDPNTGRCVAKSKILSDFPHCSTFNEEDYDAFFLIVEIMDYAFYQPSTSFHVSPLQP